MLKKWNDYLIIRRSEYFDPAYYLLEYPDCRRADVDPLWHFVERGAHEGRSPSADFDTQYYLRTNPDVKYTGINPLVHYLKHGKKEGRAPKPSQGVQLSKHRKPRQMLGLRNSIYNLGGKFFWRIPYKSRLKLLYWAYQNIGFLFAGMPHYENWRNSGSSAQINLQSNLLNIHAVEPAVNVRGRIAIHIHIFYADLVKEFSAYLRNMPFSYDLYVSVAKDEAMGICQSTFVDLPLCKSIVIKQVVNRGRDIAPIFCTFGEELANYDYIAHLHTKKSLYNKGGTVGWREYLYNNLLGSPERIRRIFALLQGDDPYGVVYPQNYVLLPYWANTWLGNRGLGYTWCNRLGINFMPRGYFDYPAGSMFWFRGDALAPLFQAGITIDDFPEEAGQNDGTLAHTIERLFVLCSLKQGMQPGIIKDDANPSWSPWRFDQYTSRMHQHMAEVLNAPNNQLLAFDIFDTLFCRPLLDPESIKRIVSRRIKDEYRLPYSEYRAIAEQQAREVKGMDVGLDEIYLRLGELTGLFDTSLAEIKKIEQEVEMASLEPREEAVALYQDAIATGKPVILISDMFLPRLLLETILRKWEVKNWQAFFLSNEVGLRKDTGKLYEHVLAQYKKIPTQMLMIGDNERSDVQIPIDQEMAVIHLLRPAELARGLPRFSNLINSHENKGDVDSEITLGLVVRKNFSPIYYPNLDPKSLVDVTPFNLGYSILGPLLVSFADWLLQQANKDGIDRLYFLSREGKPIKQIFDFWAEGHQNVPGSEYLVISRRAAGLAAISSLDDILEIAQTTYYPNTIESFLHTRFGLRLPDERWSDLSDVLNFSRDTIISIQNREIAPIVPLLQAIKADIIDRVEWERYGLLRYFSDQGLDQNSRSAVVDIGYGGSVQGYMNKLLSSEVHGYYMMTDERAMKVVENYNVLLRGCFYENARQSSNVPIMVGHSFNVEKLLSTNEPQVEYYEIDDADVVKGHFRDMLPEELTYAFIRNQLLEGAMEYTRDARYIREKMLPDFQPSCWTAQMLLETFLVQKSQKENDLLSRIVLDDYYCGRDLVT